MGKAVLQFGLERSLCGDIFKLWTQFSHCIGFNDDLSSTHIVNPQFSK